MGQVSLSKFQVTIVTLSVFAVTTILILVTPLRFVTLIEPTIDDVASQEFYKKYVEEPDKFVFLDVRGEDNYNRIHAAGSVNMPLHTLYDEWRNLPKNTNKTIVLICSGGRASGVGYHYLEHQGFFNIERIEGGIEAWQLAGLPVEAEY